MNPIKTVADVPQLVDALIAASPDVMAVGDDGYCVIDLDRPEANERIIEILEAFGPRDHLQSEIIAGLKSRGRHIKFDQGRLQ